jgi:DNA-binding GntR family transcriptional regulator
MPPPDRRAAHELLADALRADIAAGRLRPGDRLPSVRKLAEQHDLAPGTVQQAINALRRDGLVIGARGQGTRVADEAVARVPPSLEELAETVQQLSERVALVEAELRRFSHGEIESRSRE